MTNTNNITLHKDWKIVREIKIDRELERELERIIGKQIHNDSEEKNGQYESKRRSIFHKKKNL